MKRGLIFSFIPCLLLVSCKEEPTVRKKEVLKEKIRITNVEAKQFLSLEVKGMVCEIGCGSSIKNELLKTNAIASCEVDFDSKREINFVKIAFDNQRISKDKIIHILENINNKQFKVLKSADSFDKKPVSGVKKLEHKASDKLKEQEIKLEETNNTTPNIIDIYTRLVTG